jgi:hypothetical protein
MAKGRKTAALGALLGAGALAANLGRVDLNAGPKAARPELENRIPEYPVPSDDERTAARKRVYDTEPSLRGTLRTEDYRPILSGTGLPIRTGGMKSGGKVTASRRADGIAQRGKTRGKMV